MDITEKDIGKLVLVYPDMYWFTLESVNNPFADIVDEWNFKRTILIKDIEDIAEV